MKLRGEECRYRKREENLRRNDSAAADKYILRGVQMVVRIKIKRSSEERAEEP